MKFLHDLYLKILYALWNFFAGMDEEANRPRNIVHKTVSCPERIAHIDEHVVDVCRMLWDAGIETFYSCQGGPSEIRPRDRRITKRRAYVQILEKDAEKACAMLEGRNPKISIHPDREHKDRVAIRFDPSEAAMNIDIVMQPPRKKVKNYIVD